MHADPTFTIDCGSNHGQPRSGGLLTRSECGILPQVTAARSPYGKGSLMRSSPLEFALLLALAGCHRVEATPTAGSAGVTSAHAADPAMVDRYSAHGVVKSVDPDRKKLSIAHDDIPGFMKAMTMPFEVPDRSMLEGLAVGDAVDFSFTDDGSGHLTIDRMTKK